MYKDFILAEASFPKKFIAFTFFIFIFLIAGYLNNRYKFISNLDVKYEGIIWILSLVIIIIMFFTIFSTDNYKVNGRITCK